MRFSNKAYKYLDKLERDKDYLIDKDELIQYLKKNDVPIFEKVLDFQLEFSGLKLTIFNKNKSTFKAGLFTREEIRTNYKPDIIIINARYYFYCGQHETAPFWFVLSEDGELCTYDNSDETVNIISSTFDKFIEKYAFEDLLSTTNRYEHPPYYDLINREKFNKLTSDYFQHLTATDNYSKWISNEGLLIHVGTWLDRPEAYIHIYGETEQKCKEFVKLLVDNQIIK